MRTPLHRPTPEDILANPAAYAAVPGLFATAWDALKAARGQSVDFDRMGPPAHRMVTPLCATLDSARARTAVKVRDYMARRSAAPSGGDAA